MTSFALFFAGLFAGITIDYLLMRLIRGWERSCGQGHENITYIGGIMCPLCHERDAMADLEAENERLRGRCAALAFLQYGGPSPGVEPPTDVPHS